MDTPKYGNSLGNLTCSFCGKNQREVKKLIAGPSVYICDECIDLCNDIIREEGQKAALQVHRMQLVAWGVFLNHLKLKLSWMST